MVINNITQIISVNIWRFYYSWTCTLVYPRLYPSWQFRVIIEHVVHVVENSKRCTKYTDWIRYITAYNRIRPRASRYTFSENIFELEFKKSTRRVCVIHLSTCTPVVFNFIRLQRNVPFKGERYVSHWNQVISNTFNLWTKGSYASATCFTDSI